jgi:molybdenum transport protein
MFYFTHEEIDKFISEDLPYFDLTTQLADISGKSVTLEFISRQDGIVCGSEEAAMVFKSLGASVEWFKKTSEHIGANEVIFRASGDVSACFAGWKVAQNILEYASGISTTTQKMVSIAKSMSPSIEIVATRKTMPGAKKLLLKAICAGGAMPHRMGVSESVLFFEQHIDAMGGWNVFTDKFAEIKNRARERKIIVEVENLETALMAAKIGVDIIQIDKASPVVASEIINKVKTYHNKMLVSISGGITMDNIEQYASSGADILVTSSLYHAKPLDITTRILGC